LSELHEDLVLGILKGDFAEKITELIHIDLDCTVYRTGHEHLFPNLFHHANHTKKMNKDLYDQDKKKYIFDTFVNLLQSIQMVKDDIWKKASSEEKGRMIFEGMSQEAFHMLMNGPDVYDRTGKRKITQDSFYKIVYPKIPKSFKEFLEQGANSRMQHRPKFTRKMASSPDLTVISPFGDIIQYEVKYRTKGNISASEIRKYLELHPGCNLFLVTPKKPYIRIFRCERNRHEEEKIFDKAYELENKKIHKLVADRNPDSQEEYMKLLQDKDIVNHGVKVRTDYIENNYKNSQLEFQELTKDKDGNLILKFDKYSENRLPLLTYPTDLLEKYGNIIRNSVLSKANMGRK